MTSVPPPTAAPPLNLRRRFALASLAVIAVIALALGWLLSSLLTQRMLQREGEVSMDFIQNLLLTDDSGRYLSTPDDGELRQRFLLSMAHIAAMREPVRANAYLPDGTVLWSTEAALIGKRFPVNHELDEALSGQLVVHSGKSHGSTEHKDEHQGLAAQADYFVESYIPIRGPGSGQVLGVMELYKVPTQLNAAIRASLVQLWAACAASALLLFLALYWIVARAEGIMRQQRAQIEQAQTLASAVELASAVAHNLRNPLASIRVSAEMLQAVSTPAEELPEHASDIAAAVDRADRWISELVRVAQAPQLQPEPVTLAPVLQGCADELAPEMARHAVAVSVDVPAGLAAWSHAAMLRQIVLSIMANAVEAMPGGGELHIDAAALAEGVVRLRFLDTGVGVAAGDRQRLFRPFFSTKSGGLGIGLALVRRMVEQWQGHITLLPRSPRGTCVELVLRLPPGGAAAAEGVV